MVKIKTTIGIFSAIVVWLLLFMLVYFLIGISFFGYFVISFVLSAIFIIFFVLYKIFTSKGFKNQPPLMKITVIVIIAVFLLMFPIVFLLMGVFEDTEAVEGLLNIYVYLLAGMLIGAAMIYEGLRKFGLRKLIEDMPTSKIRSIAMGLVEVVGEVVPMKRTFDSIFTHQKCVYYRLLIEQYIETGDGAYWSQVLNKTISPPFYIKDETGKVLVDPKGAEMDIKRKFISFISPQADEVKKLLKKEKIKLGKLKTRVSEFFIVPNEKLYILGTAGDNPHKTEATAHHGVEDVMIQKGSNMYCISDDSEEKIINKFSNKNITFKLAFAVLILAVCFTALAYVTYMVVQVADMAQALEDLKSECKNLMDNCYFSGALSIEAKNSCTLCVEKCNKFESISSMCQTGLAKIDTYYSTR